MLLRRRRGPQRAGDRRQFVQMGLAGLSAALAGGYVDAQVATPVQPSFLCVYRPGSHWLPGKPLAEQPLREHGRYMLELYRRGVMRLAGRFADGGFEVLVRNNRRASRRSNHTTRAPRLT